MRGAGARQRIELRPSRRGGGVRHVVVRFHQTNYQVSVLETARKPRRDIVAGGAYCPSDTHVNNAGRGRAGTGGCAKINTGKR